MPNRIGLESIDLNLLRTLQALLETGSTQEAGERLGRTQSAVSHALGRLRHMFDDPLFVRVGWHLKPTPRAESLRLPLARILGDIATLVAEPDGFAPNTSRRTFRIAAPDFCIPMLAPLSARIAAEAPDVTLEFRPVDETAFDLLERGHLDTVIAPTRGGAHDGNDRQPLIALDWCVFAREGHPLGPKPSLNRWLAYPHIQVVTGETARSPIDDALLARGLTRTIAARVPTFLSALGFVLDSDCLFTAPRQAFTAMADRLALEQLPCPIDLAQIPLTASWSAVRRHDVALIWFRTLFEQVFEEGL
ncbi:MAG: LysR family transcriptional regulator [Pseudomonadota bacterium]